MTTFGSGGTSGEGRRCCAAGAGATRHPRRVAAKELPVTVRERAWNQGHAARDRENTGVYVFTRVNARGISEFNAKGLFCGYRRGNAGLLRRERVESKGSRLECASRRAHVR